MKWNDLEQPVYAKIKTNLSIKLILNNSAATTFFQQKCRKQNMIEMYCIILKKSKRERTHKEEYAFFLQHCTTRLPVHTVYCI